MTRDELIELMAQALHDGGYSIRKAIAAMEAAGVVMVPTEPTREMLHITMLSSAHRSVDMGEKADIYRWMLKASPFRKPI